MILHVCYTGEPLKVDLGSREKSVSHEVGVLIPNPPPSKGLRTDRNFASSHLLPLPAPVFLHVESRGGGAWRSTRPMGPQRAGHDWASDHSTGMMTNASKTEGCGNGDAV